MSNRVGNFFLGQSISLSIACTSIFTQYLANRNVYLSFTQSCGTYILLAFFLLSRCFGKKEVGFKTAWWKYLIVSIIDATANCLIVKAYEYTTILSIMLCDAMCIPATVVISLIFLHSKFSLRHYLAVLLCLIGLAVMIIHDAKNSSGTHRVIGDLMALSSAVLYAVSNVCQEVLVKHNDWKEFLGMLGLGGTVFSLLFIVLFERNSLIAVPWDGVSVALLAGYVVCLFAMYVITAVFMEKNDAVVFNMHLLTSDVIASVLTFFLFDDPPTLVYFIALAITIVGVVVYNWELPENDLSKRGDFWNSVICSDYEAAGGKPGNSGQDGLTRNWVSLS
ncbi:uncharacterized protein [Blastocystis hominis]|uniref:EamA domain-containing protein n=1 Tax=Blastocystis hominis TaxID=12968 RepID=D8LV99_BLAHO|nr:uncharacterized protein [Blastocystis hominis]CBK19738.2 unnamed protein product [Blastocystis hominis]|eukprot:XP_012893786.1 uncharacterized protein [Blastocystis hominis]